METNIQSTCQAFNNVRGEEPGTGWRKKIRNTFIFCAQTTSTATPAPVSCVLLLENNGCISQAGCIVPISLYS